MRRAAHTPTLLRARQRLAGTVMALALLTACTGDTPAPRPATPFKPVASVKQIMSAMTDLAADAYWDAVGSVSDKNGTREFAPTTEKGWLALEHHATVISESGNLLMMEGRARDNGEWMTLARDLVDQGEKARLAAVSRTASAVFDAGADVYQSCTNCHAKYLVTAPFGPGTSAPSPAAASPAAASPAAASPAAASPSGKAAPK